MIFRSRLPTAQTRLLSSLPKLQEQAVALVIPAERANWSPFCMAITSHLVNATFNSRFRDDLQQKNRCGQLSIMVSITL